MKHSLKRIQKLNRLANRRKERETVVYRKRLQAAWHQPIPGGYVDNPYVGMLHGLGVERAEKALHRHLFRQGNSR